MNIIVSLLTTIGVLYIKGELERVVVVTATPDSSVQEQPATAVPVVQAEQPSVTPTPSSPVEYTVQSGDTLGGIALEFDVPLENLLRANNLNEDDIIQPGDILMIAQGEVSTPTPTPTPVPPTPIPPTPTEPTPTPFPTSTPTPPGPVEVRIQDVSGPGELSREGVILVNRGRTVNLLGWTLAAAGGENVFTFPHLTLAREVPVTVYTIVGDDSPQALHWGLTKAQWGESDTVIELRDAEGDLIAAYTIP
jgi:LysM repeat protein